MLFAPSLSLSPAGNRRLALCPPAGKRASSNRASLRASLWASRPLLGGKRYEQRLLRDDVARGGVQHVDGRLGGGDERVLHLHRLEHRDRLARRDALAGGYQQLHELARHRRDNRPLHSSGLRRRRLRRARSGLGGDVRDGNAQLLSSHKQVNLGGGRGLIRGWPLDERRASHALAPNLSAEGATRPRGTHLLHQLDLPLGWLPAVRAALAAALAPIDAVSIRRAALARAPQAELHRLARGRPLLVRRLQQQRRGGGGRAASASGNRQTAVAESERLERRRRAGGGSGGVRGGRLHLRHPASGGEGHQVRRRRRRGREESVVVLRDEGGVHFASEELRRLEHAPAKRNVGGQSDGLPLAERRVEAAARGGAVRTAHN
mmetsp:Transcript_37021/g.116354  ORF Transcript_37021/g.116354 Transcript_37021/m.116354 type:complete len:377 (-) Transcript_37021:1301-2431(-)